MPPSHNCVWVPSEVPREERDSNWEKVFGKEKDKTNGGWECTCNWYETTESGKTVMVRGSCKIHGKSEKITAKITDAPKKFSKSHMDKVRSHLFYGKGDARELLQ
ncbi:MAG TPA: hypothetical protein VMV77_09160 [Bacteroidales bacterium]|nr:hypothetical protein [Bacteroidales bacterium]